MGTGQTRGQHYSKNASPCEVREDIFDWVGEVSCGIIRNLLLDGENDFSSPNMALKALSNRKVCSDRDTMLSQMLSRSNSRQHQNLRRWNSSCAQNDFTLCPGNVVLATAPESHSICARFTEKPTFFSINIGSFLCCWFLNQVVQKCQWKRS